MTSELVVRHGSPIQNSEEVLPGRNNPARLTAIRAGEDTADDWIEHLSPADVRRMADEESKNPRHGERNAALIAVIFDGALRVSEVVGQVKDGQLVGGIRPMDIKNSADGYTVAIFGKGKKPGRAAITAGTAEKLRALAYGNGHPIAPDARLFPITRSQVFRICEDAYRRAGVRQPSRLTDHVGAVHVLRHSGALARLAASGNPKSVQHQLRHRSAAMTLRYMKTLAVKESLKIQQGVSPW